MTRWEGSHRRQEPRWWVVLEAIVFFGVLLVLIYGLPIIGFAMEAHAASHPDLLGQLGAALGLGTYAVPPR